MPPAVSAQSYAHASRGLDSAAVLAARSLIRSAEKEVRVYSAGHRPAARVEKFLNARYTMPRGSWMGRHSPSETRQERLSPGLCRSDNKSLYCEWRRFVRNRKLERLRGSVRRDELEPCAWRFAKSFDYLSRIREWLRSLAFNKICRSTDAEWEVIYLTL